MSMNKINIDGVLIVEGKEDVSYLSNFVNALFFTTNGYDINKDKIDFLKAASKVNKLIIYTDPDKAGEEIRNKIKSEISDVFEAKSERIIRKFLKKGGVAELEKDEVIRTLSPFITNRELSLNTYDLVTLISLSKSPSESKEKLCTKYRLINGSIKFLENQLNILKINPKEVEELLSGN